MGASTKHSPVPRAGLASAAGLCPAAAGAGIRAGPWDLAPCLDSVASFAGSPIQSVYARLNFSNPVKKEDRLLYVLLYASACC